MSFKPITVNTPATDPAHILAQDDAILYHGIIGQDCVLDIGSKMEAVIIDNNTVRILDGAVMVQGHLGHIPHGEYEDLHIENGVAGQKRHDLIVARFKTTAGIDTYELAVIKGVPGSSGVDPDITVGNLSAGDMLREYPLYRVKIDGLLLASIERMHTVGSTIDILHQSLESHLAESASKHITESGTNSNGSYIKFDDGTMICYSTRVCSTPPDSPHGVLYGTESEQWTFPSRFISVPSVFINEVKGAGSCWGALGGSEATTIGTSFRLYRATNSNLIPTAGLFAIGRWK